MNTCKCGGEVFLDYRQGYYTGQHWYVICGDCGNEIPLNANNRIDAIREWNNMQVDEPQEQTNEEWLNSLNTADKAHFLSVEAARAISEYKTGKVARTGISFWNCWLKGVHKE